jgi:molybdopterin synthase catalytic subunit
MDEPSILLVRQPLDAAAALLAVSGTGIGGVDLFLGLTRAEHHPHLGQLIALDYHAYEEMALAEMRRLVQRAASQWPLLKVVVCHRLGIVEVSQASVIIAVGCAHRADAFSACRYLIDELKKTVPIWKKELYTTDARWQGDGL